jgi:hypothetical protein
MVIYHQKSENQKIFKNIFIIPNAEEDQLRARAHIHRLKFNLLSKDVGAVATVLVPT